MEEKIILEKISKDFGDLKVIDGLDVEIRKNEFTIILGPSGCGKTTLIKILAGLVKPDSGKVSIFGHSPEQIRSMNKYGIVFQDKNLIRWRSVKQNIELPGEIIDKKYDATRLLRIVGLRRYGNYYPDEISVGMQQRVAIARAIASSPEILLLDEPFSSLDELAREKLQIDLLRIWNESKLTAIHVTHNIHEAAFLADRIIILSSKPSRMIASIKINLPRPRSLSVLRSLRYHRYITRIRSLIKDEKQGYNCHS